MRRYRIVSMGKEHAEGFRTAVPMVVPFALFRTHRQPLSSIRDCQGETPRLSCGCTVPPPGPSVSAVDGLSVTGKTSRVGPSNQEACLRHGDRVVKVEYGLRVDSEPLRARSRSQPRCVVLGTLWAHQIAQDKGGNLSNHTPMAVAFPPQHTGSVQRYGGATI